ncbi:MAG TPA: hypothetical protein VF278_22580 [Pirellulales bacterium]
MSFVAHATVFAEQFDDGTEVRYVAGFNRLWRLTSSLAIFNSTSRRTLAKRARNPLMLALVLQTVAVSMVVQPGRSAADDARVQNVPPDWLERYEAALQSLQHTRLHIDVKVYFTGGPFDQETKVVDRVYDCVRDRGRWKIDKKQSETARINGVWRTLSVHQQDVGTEAGTVDVWVHPADDKWPEEFDIIARLLGEAPAAHTKADVRQHRGDLDSFAEIPRPTTFGKAGFIFGYVHFDGVSRLSTVLAESGTSATTSLASGGLLSRDVLVESRGKYGRHRVWFDPDVGFLPRRVEVEKFGSDIFGTGTVASLGPHGLRDSFWPDLPVERVDITIDDVQIEQTGGAFVITGFTYKLTRHHPQLVLATERTDVRVTNIDLNPVYGDTDFKITVPIPDGTPVHMRGVSQIAYEWRDGEVVKSLDQGAAKALSGQTFSAGEGAVWKVWLLVGATLIGALLVTAAIWSRRRSRSRTPSGL